MTGLPFRGSGIVPLGWLPGGAWQPSDSTLTGEGEGGQLSSMDNGVFNGTIGSNPIVVAVLAVALFALGRRFIRRIVRSEGGDPWLAKALTACLVVHLLAAPLQIWAVNHLYGGIADYTRYIYRGAALAGPFRHFNFSLPPNLGGIVDNGSISIVAGILFAIVGINQAAAFLIMSFLSFIGITCFYRAFTLTFNGANKRRYGYLIFFLPSLIFWTADVSKEAIMLFLLGVLTYGCALVLARRGGYRAWLLIVAACTGSVFVRPNEMLLVLGGFTIAMIFRPSEAKTKFKPARRTFSLVFLSVGVAVVMFLTLHFLPGLHGSVNLSQINQQNQGPGSGFGSSGVAYSQSPAAYPKDVYTVLFDPLPFNAHSGGERFQSLQNTVLLVLLIASIRNLRILPRAALARPYLIMCFIYVVSFCYFFAALGNLGLIAREATVMVPLYLVLLCIPRGPRRQPPRYIWELTRRQRVAYKRAGAQRRAAARA
jgi:hypothetical protein